MDPNINSHTLNNMQDLAEHSNSQYEKKAHVTENQEEVNALFNAARSLADGKIKEAENIIKKKYPFIPIKRESRKATTRQLMEQFFSDGFQAGKLMNVILRIGIIIQH